MSRQWWPVKSNVTFSVTLTLCDFVLVLNTLGRESSDLPEFNQTHNATMFSFKAETFALQVRDN